MKDVLEFNQVFWDINAETARIINIPGCVAKIELDSMEKDGSYPYQASAVWGRRILASSKKHCNPYRAYAELLEELKLVKGL